MKNYIVHIEGQTDITIRADTPMDAEYEASEQIKDSYCDTMALEVRYTEACDADTNDERI